MARATIDRTIVFYGDIYLAGDHELPADRAKQLMARCDELRALDAAAGVVVNPPAELPALNLGPAVSGPGTPLESLGLSDDLAELLRGGGFETVESVAGADDARLMVVPGIGEGRVRQIRKALEDAAGTAPAE